MEKSLQFALDHLKAFRATFNDGDPVDEESGLTAHDLTIVIEHCDRPADDVAAEALGGFA